MVGVHAAVHDLLQKLLSRIAVDIYLFLLSSHAPSCRHTLAPTPAPSLILTLVLAPSPPLTPPRPERVWLCDQLGGPVVWVGGRFGVNGPQSQTPPEGTAAPCGTKGAPLCVDGIEGCVCVACCALPSVPCAL